MWRLNAELDFADQVGRFFARQYGMPPATGRVAGWLLICDPPAQTAAEIAEALQMSRSAVGAAVSTLETARDAAAQPAPRASAPTASRSTPPTASSRSSPRASTRRSPRSAAAASRCSPTRRWSAVRG